MIVNAGSQESALYFVEPALRVMKRRDFHSRSFAHHIVVILQNSKKPLQLGRLEPVSPHVAWTRATSGVEKRLVFFFFMPPVSLEQQYLISFAKFHVPRTYLQSLHGPGDVYVVTVFSEETTRRGVSWPFQELRIRGELRHSTLIAWA